MIKKMNLLLAWAVLLFGAMASDTRPSAFNDETCTLLTSLTINRALTETISQRTCFLVTVSRGDLHLIVDFQVSSGQFDLYLGPSSAPALTDADHKLNWLFGAIFDYEKFALRNLSPGDYTIAVKPLVPSSRYTLIVRTEDISTSYVSGDTERAAAGLGEAVRIDPGDYVQWPLDVTCPGKITVRATWSGAPRQLEISLYGSDRIIYARRQSGSPLTLEYAVTAADIQRGKRWQAILYNSSASRAGVTVDITYPTATCPSAGGAGPTLIDFDTWPDGRRITATQILVGDEFAKWGIKVSAAPTGSYCSDARPAVRLSSYASVPYLSTARPTQPSACETVPVRIDFTSPVKSVTVYFVGAAVPYTLTAYDSQRRLLGTATKTGQLGIGLTTTYNSSSANVSRITFGRQSAVTVIMALMVER